MSDVIFSEKPFNYLIMLKCALDMAKAVHFLHSNGVLHRDIKPDNFLVISLSSKAPVTCKIADFGTSRYIHPFWLFVYFGIANFSSLVDHFF